MDSAPTRSWRLGTLVIIGSRRSGSQLWQDFVVPPGNLWQVFLTQVPESGARTVSLDGEPGGRAHEKESRDG